MKKTKTETMETHKRIVQVAAQAFKKNGIDATGVAEIMAAAGLTHGAFYRHFSSKEALVAEAAGVSMDVFVEAARSAAEKGPSHFVRYLQKYMTSEFRDGEMGGCPVIQMGSELARAETSTREGVANGLEQLIDIAVDVAGEDAGASTRDDAIFTLSAMIGAITMSRLVEDPKLSKHILDVTNRRLLAPPKKGPAKKAAVEGAARGKKAA